ncbi:MAG: heat-inducible transcriptional repressor HrcA [Faecalibacterium sp.]
MAMDARKQRVLQAIVALYGLEGEPVGSSVLANYFDMAVSSATLRNEMAALTKLGLLEQPHTSAGRVPSAKGYRYYLDNLLTDNEPLDRVTGSRVDAVFASLDHEPDKLAQGAAKALAQISGCTAAVSTPCADDLCIAHFEVVQVGRSSAAVLAVTTAGYVRTRVARVRSGLTRDNAAALAALLNRNLTFVAPMDLSRRLLAELCSQTVPELVPVISAAAAILQDCTTPHVYLGGEQHLLEWPQLEGKVGSILTMLNEEAAAARLIQPPAGRNQMVLLGEDLDPQIPGLCIVSDRYLVGGGLSGSIALVGPTRMPFQKLMPLLHAFADQLGEAMAGKRKDTPQAASPRRTVIYKEDLE